MSGLVQNIVDAKAVPRLNALDVFNHTPAFDYRFKYSTYQTFYPEATTGNNIRFAINQNFGQLSLDLSKCIVVADVKLVDKLGNRVATDSMVAVQNNILYNLFRSVKIYLNNTQISNQSLYPYYNYLSTKLTSTSFDASSHLLKQGWLPDKAGQFDTAGAANPGWVARRNQFGGMVRNEEKQVDEFVYNTNNHTYVGLLKTNLPEMSWLPNPCNLKIDIEKNSSDFCLHSASEVDAKIVLENIELRILTYTLADPLYKTLMEKISTEPLKYDYHRADLDIYSIPTGTRQHIIENVNLGKIPNKIMVLMQETERFEGSQTLNSLRFPRQFGAGSSAVVLESCKLNIAGSDVDGLFQETVDAHVSLPYFKYFLMNDMLSSGSNLSCALTPAEFETDLNFSYFDCSVSLGTTPTYAKSPTKHGYSRLYLNFSDQTPCSITVIVLVISDQVLKIEKNGKYLKYIRVSMYEKILLEPCEMQFPANLRMLCLGGSMCGKTSFIISCLANKEVLFQKPYSLVIYVSPNLSVQHLSHEEELCNKIRVAADPIPVEFEYQIPKVDQLLERVDAEDKRILLIFDDMTENLWNSYDIAQIYTRLSSHFGIDCISTAHTPFSTGKYYSLIYQSTNLVILWQNLSNKSALTFLTRKMFPHCYSFLSDCFVHAVDMSGSRCHLAIDCCLDKKTNVAFPVRTNVIPYKNKFGKLVHQPVFFKYQEKKK